MIQPIKEPETPEPEDMFKLCYIAVNMLGGVMTVPQKVFDEFPKKCVVTFKWNPEGKSWTFFAPTPPKKRKRGVLRPSKRIILPGG